MKQLFVSNFNKPSTIIVGHSYVSNMSCATLTGDHNLKGLDTQKIANMCDLYTRKLHSSRLKITKVGDYDYTYTKDHNRFKRGGRNQNVSDVFQGVLRGAVKL